MKKSLDEMKNQKMPRKLMELLESAETSSKNKKKKSQNTPGLLAISVDNQGDDEVGATRALKSLPDKVEQGNYETEDQFLNRLERLSAKAKAEANIEHKYDVDFCPKIISTAGEGSRKVKVKKNTKEEQEAEDKKAAKRLKSRVRDIKRKAPRKKKRGEGNHREFSDLVDSVKFGEVSMQPPTLPAFRKRGTK